MMSMIRCIDCGADIADKRFSSEMYIEATMTILVTKGWLTLETNRRQRNIGPNQAVLLSSSHMLRIAGCSPEFEGKWLAVGEEFMTEMDSVDMIYKRIRYGVKLYDRPVISLTQAETNLIGRRLAELQQSIENTAHLYYRDVVLNRLFAFYLDLSDIIDRAENMAATERAVRYESMVKRFIELLTANYRTEHKVDFYASQLNMSAHHLTLIVKEVTGRSVSDFIFGILYSDARTLLSESQMSIQEIAAMLNFSDQSSFGKFFKRRSGMSPLDWRKKRS